MVMILFQTLKKNCLDFFSFLYKFKKKKKTFLFIIYISIILCYSKNNKNWKK